MASANTGQRMGSFDLEGAHIASEERAIGSKGTKWRIVIRAKGRTFTLTAADKETRDEWAAAFTRARDSAESADQLKGTWAQQGDDDCMACIADFDSNSKADEEDDTSANDDDEDNSPAQLDVFDLSISLATGDSLGPQSDQDEPEAIPPGPASPARRSTLGRWLGRNPTKRDQAPGQQVVLGDLIDRGSDRPVLLLLLRHFGCMLCRRAIGHVTKIYPRLEELGVRAIAVSTGGPDAALKFAEETKFPGRVVSDTKRVLYKAFNCRRGVRLCLGKATLAAAKLARAEGYAQGAVAGDLYQLGGAFVLSRKHGMIYEYGSKFAGDMANLRELLNAVETYVLQHHSIDSWSNIYALRTENRLNLASIDKANNVSADEASPLHISAVRATSKMLVRESVFAYDSLDGRASAAALSERDEAPFDALINSNHARIDGLSVFVDVQSDQASQWVAEPLLVVVERPRVKGERECGQRLTKKESFQLTLDGVVKVDANTAAAPDESDDGVRVLVISPQRTVRLRVPLSYAKDDAQLLSRAKLTLLEVPGWIGTRGGTKADRVDYLTRVVRIPSDPKVLGNIRVFEQRAEAALRDTGSGPLGFAVSVLYCGRNQGRNAGDVWANSGDCSPTFVALLEALGKKVPLASNKEFVGGLDTSGRGHSGELTYTTTFAKMPYVFHVGPMIPLDEGYLQRKLHLSKNPVLIVFTERDSGLLDVDKVRCEANQVVIVVRPAAGVKAGQKWELEVVRHVSVPPVLSAAIELAGPKVSEPITDMVEAATGQVVRVDPLAMMGGIDLKDHDDEQVFNRLNALNGVSRAVSRNNLVLESFAITTKVLRPLLLTLVSVSERATLRYGSVARLQLERDRRIMLDRLISSWGQSREQPLTLTSTSELEKTLEVIRSALNAGDVQLDKRRSSLRSSMSSASSDTRESRLYDAPPRRGGSSSGEDDSMGGSRRSVAMDVAMMVDIQYSELKPGKVLGKGHFGEVRQALWNGTPVACKVLYRESFMKIGQLELFLKEAQLLSQIKHPNIVQFMGVAMSPSNSAVLVTELMPGLSLRTRVHKADYQVSLRFARDVTEQVSRGMIYLHKRDIIHRDLSSNNILLDDARETRAKIADFGLSVEADKAEARTGGALLWMSPEVYKGKEYSHKMDSFAFGVVLYEMCTGRPPNATSNMGIREYVVAVALHKHRAPIPKGLPRPWRALIDECWADLPDLRPTFAQILERADTLPGPETVDVDLGVQPVEELNWSPVDASVYAQVDDGSDSMSIYTSQGLDFLPYAVIDTPSDDHTP